MLTVTGRHHDYNPGGALPDHHHRHHLRSPRLLCDMEPNGFPSTQAALVEAAMNDDDLRQAAITALRKLHNLRDFNACIAVGARVADDLLNDLEGVLLRIVVTQAIE